MVLDWHLHVASNHLAWTIICTSQNWCVGNIIKPPPSLPPFSLAHTFTLCLYYLNLNSCNGFMLNKLYNIFLMMKGWMTKALSKLKYDQCWPTTKAVFIIRTITIPFSSSCISSLFEVPSVSLREQDGSLEAIEVIFQSWSTRGFTPSLLTTIICLRGCAGHINIPAIAVMYKMRVFQTDSNLRLGSRLRAGPSKNHPLCYTL